MLSHKEIQQLLLADISLQVVVYLDRPHAYRGSGVDQITYLQRKETAHIGNDLVDREKHILCISLLDGLAVNIQMERNAVHISHTLQWDECPKNSRIIERLADFPRQTLRTQLVLQSRAVKSIPTVTSL